MKKLKYLLLTFVLLITGIINVRAEADLSNIKLSVVRPESIDSFTNSNTYIYIENGTFDETKNYRALVTSTNKDIPDTYELGGDFPGEDTDLRSLKLEDETIIKNAAIPSRAYLPIAEKTGDVYVTIYESTTGAEYKKVSDTILVKRLDYLPLTKRIKAHLFQDHSSIYVYELYNTERNINYKIGKVTDKTLLNSLKAGNASSLERLLTYAKNDQNPVKTGVANFGMDQTSIFEQKNISEGNYYYVYFEVEDENGTYYSIEDVNLYQALRDVDGLLWLTSMDDAQFKWYLEETIWDKFVANFKESEYLDVFDTASLNVTHTDSNMIVTVDDGLNVYTTEFKYENGIVSYVEPEKASDSQKLLDSILVEAALMEFAELYKYDQESFVKFIDSAIGLTLTKDGIEFVNNLYVLEEKAEGGSGTITFTNWKSLKFDLLNGLKTFAVKEEVKDVDTTIENPETGVLIGICAILLTGIAGTIGTVVYRNVNRKNKMAKI